MAITAPEKLDQFSGFLPRHMAAPYFAETRRNSVVQQLARQVQLGINGESIPITTGKPTANWVAEGAKKPASRGAMTLKTMDPKKIAVIVAVSQEVVRADPGGYVSSLRADMAEAFGIAFDLAAMHDLGGDGTGTGPFTTFLDQTTKEETLGTAAQGDGGVYEDLNQSIGQLISDTNANGRHYRATGFALDLQVETRLRSGVDTSGRPLWTDLPTGTEPSALTQSGTLLARRTFMGEGVALNSEDIIGYLGQWDQAVWGTVGGISFGVSDVATITIDGELVSTWENNLFAIKAEAEFGFLVNDVDAFVKLIDTTLS